MSKASLCYAPTCHHQPIARNRLRQAGSPHACCRASSPRFHAGFSFDFERYSSFIVDCARFSPSALALKPRPTVHFRSLPSNSGELRTTGEQYIYLVDMVGSQVRSLSRPPASKARDAAVCLGFRHQPPIGKVCFRRRLEPRVSNGFQFGPK